MRGTLLPGLSLLLLCASITTGFKPHASLVSSRISARLLLTKQQEQQQQQHPSKQTLLRLRSTPTTDADDAAPLPADVAALPPNPLSGMLAPLSWPRVAALCAGQSLIGFAGVLIAWFSHGSPLLALGPGFGALDLRTLGLGRGVSAASFCWPLRAVYLSTSL